MVLHDFSLPRVFAGCLVVLSFAGGSHSFADDVAEVWPQFRGPDGQGHVQQQAVPTQWSESEGVRWKTPLPGRGWSSPVVWGNQIWMTTAIEQAAPDEEKEARVPGDIPASALNLASQLTLRALCVDRTTGELIHNIKLIDVDEPNVIHSLNSYASPTPVVEQGRLYCHFGRYGTVCLDTASQSILSERQFLVEHYVGPGSSPVVHGDLLVLTCDGADKQYIAAVDKNTGEDRWIVDRPPIRSTNPDFRKSYCTPLVVEHEGREEIVIVGAQWIIAYAPEDGRELWRIDHGSGFSVVPRPVMDDQYIYCCTGFNGVGIVAVRLGGEGDIGNTHIEWTHRQQAPTQPSPVLVDGKLYLVSDNGIGQCLDAATGDVIWKKRLPGDYSASPLHARGDIYFFNREGETTIVPVSGKGDPSGSNQLDSGIMATPAVVGGEFLIRTETHLYAIGG